MGAIAHRCLKESSGATAQKRRRGLFLLNPYRQPFLHHSRLHRTFRSNAASNTATPKDDQLKPVQVDHLTMEAIQAEVMNLMYAGRSSGSNSDGNRAAKVTEIATALKNSKHVMELYMSATTNNSKEGIAKTEENLDHVFSKFEWMMRFGDRLGGVMKKQKDDQFVKRRYRFFQVLDYLERRPESISTRVSNWNEAREALSVVITFPDDRDHHDAAKKAKPEPTVTAAAAVASYKQITPVSERKSLSQELWKRIGSQMLPSKLADKKEEEEESKKTDVAKPPPITSAIDLVDAKRTELLTAKYIELDERLKSPDLEALEQRQKEKEAKDRASSLMRQLTEQERAIVKQAIYGLGPPNQILAQIGTDSVQRRSLHRLQPGQWLNDEVIHYFLVVLAKRDEELCRLDRNRKPTHFFKSFFITKLLNEGDSDPAKEGTYEYRNVKRWSKNVKGKDIFKLSKIFFTINQNQMHWLCAVAFMDEKRIQMYDSMGSNGMYFLENIFRYIQDEHLEKKGTPLPNTDQWKLIPCTQETPAQHNGYDCGVFTCMFADFLSKDCPLIFNQNHINQCRERIALSIMNGSAIM